MLTSDRNLQRRSRSMPQLLADDIRMQLVAGDLLPGQPLPPEKILMETYGVSRPTLREALQILQAESLVETIRGAKGGVVMRAPDPMVVIRQVGVHLQLSGASFADVYKARAPIEISSARILAERSHPDDIEALHLVLQEGWASISQGGEDWARIAGRFHRTIVHRSGNLTMSFVVDMLASFTDATYNRQVARHEPDDRRALQTKAARSWSKLVDLIADRSPDAAEDHWARHLNLVGVSVGDEDRPLAAEVLPHSSGSSVKAATG